MNRNIYIYILTIKSYFITLKNIIFPITDISILDDKNSLLTKFNLFIKIYLVIYLSYIKKIIINFFDKLFKKKSYIIKYKFTEFINCYQDYILNGENILFKVNLNKYYIINLKKDNKNYEKIEYLLEKKDYLENNIIIMDFKIKYENDIELDLIDIIIKYNTYNKNIDNNLKNILLFEKINHNNIKNIRINLFVNGVCKKKNVEFENKLYNYNVLDIVNI